MDNGITSSALALLALQALGVVAMFLIGFAVKKISADSEENRNLISKLTDRVGELALKMSEHYVTKDDWQGTRDKVHDLTEKVMELRTLSQMHRRTGHD